MQNSEFRNADLNQNFVKSLSILSQNLRIKNFRILFNIIWPSLCIIVTAIIDFESNNSVRDVKQNCRCCIRISSIRSTGCTDFFDKRTASSHDMTTRERICSLSATCETNPDTQKWNRNQIIRADGFGRSKRSNHRDLSALDKRHH